MRRYDAPARPSRIRLTTLIAISAMASSAAHGGQQTTIPVIVNRNGGTAGRLGDGLRPALEQAFAAAGLAADIHLIAGEAIRETVRAHRDAPLVVVGGGDGRSAARRTNWRAAGRRSASCRSARTTIWPRRSACHRPC